MHSAYPFARKVDYLMIWALLVILILEIMRRRWDKKRNRP